MSPSPSSTQVAAESGRFKRPLWFWPVSAFLLLHLVAVFISPFAFISSSPGTSSPAAAVIAGVFRPYNELTYLNHGYAFFAPNPGPSHLVRCRLEFDDGRPAQTKTFPDLRQHWPRLLYHRHFMLSEQLHSDSISPKPPVTDDEGQLRQWRRRRDIFEAKLHSYENHLRTQYGANRVELVRIEHQQPAWADVLLRDKQLDDADLFRNLSPGPAELPDPTFTRLPGDAAEALNTDRKDG